MATKQEYLEAARRADAAGDTEAARRLVQAAKAAGEAEATSAFAVEQARPLTRMEPQYPVFAPTFDIERRITEAVEKKAKEEVAARGPTLAPGTSIYEARAEREKEAREAAEKARARTVQPGVERPVEPGILPMFRPTRIEDVPFVELTPGGQRVPVEQVYKYGPYDPTALLAEQTPETRRMYRDPATGELREPSLEEEFTESFAQQTEVPEARFRAEAEERVRQQYKIDKAVERGEDVPFFDRYLAPATFGILTSELEGKGLVETPLMATLRAGLSYVENAAAEGYFRALGYEVDENGIPVDPDDVGLAIAEVRDKLGVPDVVYPLQAPAALTAFLAEKMGAAPEQAQRVKDLVMSVPHLAIPLPGVATERQRVKTTRFDPEGRRVVGDEEAPNLFVEPAEAFDFYKRKVIENVAKGRTFADEWYDTPALREHYAYVTGDPEWAYYAGMVPSMFTPAGPGTAARLIGKGASGAADLLKMSSKAKALKAVDRATDEINKIDRAFDARVEQARTQGFVDFRAIDAEREAAKQVARARLDDLTKQAAAEVSPGVVRKVAEAAVKVAVPDSAKAKPFIEAIKDPANAVETPTDLLRLARSTGLLDETEAARVTRLTLRNTPDDYVLISDAVAVPRYQAKELKPVLDQMRKSLFLANIPAMAQNLTTMAARLPAGSPVAAKLNSLASTLINDPITALKAGRYLGEGDYFLDLNKAIQREIETAYKAAARQVGDNPARAFKEFSQNTPKQAAEMAAGGGIGRELAKYDSWDQVPAALRRQAIDAHDTARVYQLGRHARKANQLTRAQIYFDTAEQGLQVKQAKLFDTPFLRRLRAAGGEQRTETLSAARVANEIKRAGQTSLRDLKKLFADEVEQTGTVDDALNNLLRKQLTEAGEGPERAWDALYGLMYGDRFKDKALAAARARVPGLTDNFPTIDAVRVMDKELAEAKIVEAPTAFGRVLPGIFTPDFEAAFLKVMLEEGLRKNLSKVRRDTQIAEAAFRGGPEGRLDERGFFDLNIDETLEELLTKEGKLLPLPERAKAAEKVPEYFNEFMGVRGHVYDTSAGQAEKMLAEGVGEGLFTALDDIPVRARADAASYARDAVDLALGAGRRNLTQRMMYGYVVPNLVTQGGRLLSMALVPMATIGAKQALEATGRGAVKAAEAVGLRRLTGGGITTPDGIYYSPKVLDDLGNSYGLGVSQLETERVGTLARELMNEVNRQARFGRAAPVADAVSMLNPLDKGFFLRAAEAIELGFRKSVFEMALARGDTPAEAAELARKSQFDYSRTPDFIQQSMGQYLGESSALYQATAEALLRIKENPQVATAVLKANRQRAEAQDPYNIHGDKALKTLGIITTDNKDTYYLPDTPMLRPVEAVLGGARRADHLMSDLLDAYKLEGPLGTAYTAAVGGGGLVLRTAGDILLPGVVEAYDRFDEGEEYITTGVPEATPMSDEKVFWTLALAAQLRDPQHEPGGDWQTFISYFDPVTVEPPSDQTIEFEGRKYWNRQPPEGTPHLFMGFDDKNRRLYYAFEPSDNGMKNIKIMRTLTPEVLERVLPIYTTMDFEKAAPGKATAPYAIYAEPLVPTSTERAAMEAVLPRVEMTPEEARRQQAEAVRSVREQIKVD